MALGVITAVAVVGIASHRYLPEYFRDRPVPARLKGEQMTWGITVTTRSGEHLTDDSRQKVEEFIRGHLKQNGNWDPKVLAKQTQNQFNFKRVSLLAVSPQQISAVISLRNPVMRIELDRTRLVDDVGVVFGEAQSHDAALPLLKGTLDPTKLIWNEDQTLQLGAGHHEVIQQALQLQKDLAKFKITPDSLAYVKHRGFTATIRDTAIEVTMGLPPFDSRTDKLSQILEKMRRDGIHSARIELDYKNKAFIKEGNTAVN